MLPPPPPLPVLVRTFPYNCPYFSVLVRTFCYFSVLDYNLYSSGGEGVRAADSQCTGPEIDPGRDLVLYSAGRGGEGAATYFSVLVRTFPYLSVLDYGTTTGSIKPSATWCGKKVGNIPYH